MTIVLVWFVMQVVAMLVTGAASGVHPFTQLEQQVLLWPPSQPIGQWLERVFIAPLFRWDALHYLNLAINGYRTGSSSNSFYPLYPLAAKPLILAGIAPMVGLTIVASLSALGFAFAFYRLARLDLPADTAKWATIFLFVFPMAISLFLPYAEPLVFLLMALSLYAMRKQRWWLAGLLGMLATFAKQPGLFLVIPLAFELWKYPANRRFSWAALKNWAAALLIPLSMGGWFLYRSLVIEKVQLDFSNLQKLFLSLLVSSSADDMVRSRAFTWPWQVMIDAVQQAARQPDVSFQVAVNLSGFLFLVLLMVFTWRSLRNSYRFYSLAILVSSLLTLSIYECPTPLPSLFRHAFFAFPVFLGVPDLFKSKWTRLLFSVVCILLFILLIYGYTIERWIV